MPVTSCKTCGAEVSSDFCSRCGRPAPRVNTGFGVALGLVFLVLIGLAVVVSVVNSLSHGTESSKPVVVVSEKDKQRQKLRESLEPPTKTPLTAKQHLDAAKRLLAQMDVNEYDKSDVLVGLITDHGVEARKDPHTKAQADIVMKRMASKALEAVKMEAWRTPETATTAKRMCQSVIDSHLRAPSTADWMLPTVGRWRDHPGYFLVTYTVDAQNGFGAKIRASYQCQVVCLTAEVCEVKKVNEVPR